MDFEVTLDDIDSKEKHQAFLALHGEEAYEDLTSDEPEEEEGEDELPDGQMSRAEFEGLSPSKKKTFIDDGGRVVNE